jgi:hypothetical protein
MKYSDFVLHFRPGAAQQAYQVTACSAEGTATGSFRIPPALQEGGELLEELRYASPDRTRGRRHPPAGRAGTELFLALFRESILRLLDFATKRQGENGARPRLNLRLHFAAEGQDLERLDNLPWELLRDPRTNAPVQRTYPIVRFVTAPRSVRPPALSLPLRVLAVVPHTSGPTSPSPDREGLSFWAEPSVDVTVLEAPTPHEVHRTLREESFQVLHLMGHGAFEAKSWRPHTDASYWEHRELTDLLTNASDLRMVVLNPCNSGSDPFAEVNPIATELVRNGVPAVVAMQYPISDRAARIFSHAFYKHLAAGDSLVEAVGEGHSAMNLEAPQEWAAASLYLPYPSEGLSAGDTDSRKRDRHAELVDKKFHSMLTDTEQAELMQLQAYLDEADSKFYEPIEKKLELALTKLRQRSQAR